MYAAYTCTHELRLTMSSLPGPVSKTVPKTYTSNSLGACSPSKKLCGKQIYAYRGNGTDGSKYHTNGKTYIIDICKTQNVSSTDINFTLASFKQLGGSVKGGNLTNVKSVFHPLASCFSIASLTEPLLQLQVSLKGFSPRPESASHRPTTLVRLVAFFARPPHAMLVT